jgi:hypothetical protein
MMPASHLGISQLGPGRWAIRLNVLLLEKGVVEKGCIR